jgi:Homing endonuclease associated repeat
MKLAGTSKRTPAADVVAAAYTALAPEEREEAFVKINDLRLRELAGADDEVAYYVRSLVRVADVAGCELTPAVYRSAWRTLLADGEDIAEFNAVVRFFGSWRQAKQALELAAVDTPRRIEARFRGRLVGKVHRYREQTLRETLERCARDLGHVPLVIEFEHWRRRELELAKARGEELWLPSDSPYRRRFGTWETALLYFGFTPEAVAERLEPGRALGNANLVPFKYRPGHALMKNGPGA